MSRKLAYLDSVRFALGLAALAHPGLAGTAHAAPQTITNGTQFRDTSGNHSGKCLDVVSGSTADGAAVKQYTCNGGSNQQFQFQDAGGGYYRMVARHSGKCLDVVSGSTADGAAVKQYACNGGSNQQWESW